MSFKSALPIDALLPDVAAALAAHACAVVLAAPGAGKTTRIPLYLRDAAWLGERKIVMLEPRRLAARMSAVRMADTIGEAVGETVGFRVRLESKVSTRTRIEVVTEGILTRRLQSDPELADVGLLIFDEFHERSLDADLGLALALDIQRALRPDLKILVMSATLDDQAVADVLGNAPVLASSHRPFPVETRYLGAPAGDDLAREMAAAVRRALADEDGSILAFLPGEGEIRRTAALLEEGGLPSGCVVSPLFGALSPEDQNRAISPAPAGRRKVVLATTIAETSLTIEGVRIVIDCGYKRAPRFDPGRGMTQLVSVRVSRAAAEQRRGRAGRLGPGVCYRLWSEPEDRGLKAYDEPEMLQADLAPLALDLASWGVADPQALSWLTPPPVGAFAQASDLLRRLDALDGAGRITTEGKAMAALPLHPRLAHLVHRGVAMGYGTLACDVAALLSERDVLMGTRDPDIRLRLDALNEGGRSTGLRVNHGALARVRAAAKQIRGIAGAKREGTGSASAGILVALAYPDRIAQRRGGDGRFRLSGGGGAFLDPAESLAAQDYLAVADLDGAAREGRIYLAASIAQGEIEEAFAQDIAEGAEVVWDSREEAIAARQTRRLGALVLEAKPLRNADTDLMQAAMITGVRDMGLAALPWTDSTRMLRERIAVLRTAFPEDNWPDLSDATLLQTLDEWLGPYLQGITRRSHLTRLDLDAALRSLLPWPLPQRLDELAPTHLPVPSGSHIAVDYSNAGSPALYVKLQEVFGLKDTPAVAGGRIPVTLHLLSPAQRPIAVTADLKSFWANVYPQVRGEMRGRYPRHIWPENPLEATAVRRSIKPRGT
ncbi:MAG: ATP-dependent helicase HrpB [Proteobacteria bacterium]|nr:ATP-dependent helicase HrpB [Pseudomonadota bacterium]